MCYASEKRVEGHGDADPKNSKRISGDETACEESLKAMQAFKCGECEACKKGDACMVTWMAYQNHDLGHHDLGHLQFLAVGPGCTFKEPPARYPDTRRAIGWRYLLVGKVDLKTGAIVE